MGDKPKVLLVDDELNVIKALVRIFRDDYEVFYTTNTQDIFSIIKNSQIDVIICDQRMPGISGVDVLRYVKSVAPNTVRILMTGYSDIEVIVSAINEGSIFYYISKPWDNKSIKKVVSEAVLFKKRNEEKDALIINLTEDKAKWMEIIELLKKRDTEVNGILALSEVKKALYKSQESYEKVISFLNSEKKNLLSAGAEYNRMKTELVVRISHEFRTPLNIILCALQLINNNFDGGSKDFDKNEIKRYLSSIKQNCYRILRLTNNLIEVNEISSGNYKIYPRECDIVQIVGDIVTASKDYLKNQDICICFSKNTDKKVIVCDSNKIEKAILNLVSNAVKCSSAGDKVFIGLHDAGESVLITVRDEGAGIEQDKLNTIFEGFKQADELLIRNNEGAGVGLFITNYIVGMHYGKISVKSRLNKGSEFIIELPTGISLKDDKSRVFVNEFSIAQKVSIEFSDIITE